MIKSILAKKKRELWPEIENWSADPPKEIYEENNIRKLKMSEFVWFHPAAYKLLYYGMYPAIAFPFMIIAIFLLIYRQPWFTLILPCLVVLFALISLAKRCRCGYEIRGMTLYDLFLRE